MDDDIAFCAKTGRQIGGSQKPSTSNVIPFPRRSAAQPNSETPESYAEAVTIRSSGTLADIDKAARAEIAALAERAQENDDI